MAAIIEILDMATPVEPADGIVVNTTSRASEQWERSLSPFNLGPCRLYGGRESLVMENAWQYSKLYAVHADATGEPTNAYWEWAQAGWANPRAVRFPMGRSARPLWALWDGARLDYVSARKKIYGPLYAEAVQKTEGWARLKALYASERLLILRDFDGYDHASLGLTLTEVLNNTNRKMGHSFVLAMLLTADEALQQLELRPAGNS